MSEVPFVIKTSILHYFVFDQALRNALSISSIRL